MVREGACYVSEIYEEDRLVKLPTSEAKLYVLNVFARLYPTNESICLRVLGHRPFIYLGTVVPLARLEDVDFIRETFQVLLRCHSSCSQLQGCIDIAEHHIPFRGYHRPDELMRFWRIHFPTMHNLNLFVQFWTDFLVNTKDPNYRDSNGKMNYRIDPFRLAQEAGKYGLQHAHTRWRSAPLNKTVLGLFTGGFRFGSVGQLSLCCIMHQLPTAGWLEFRGAEPVSYQRFRVTHEVQIHVTDLKLCENPPVSAMALRCASYDFECQALHEAFTAAERDWRFIEHLAQAFIHRWRIRYGEALAIYEAEHPTHRKLVATTQSVAVHNLFAGNRPSDPEVTLLTDAEVVAMLELAGRDFHWVSPPSYAKLLDLQFSDDWADHGLARHDDPLDPADMIADLTLEQGAEEDDDDGYDDGEEDVVVAPLAGTKRKPHSQTLRSMRKMLCGLASPWYASAEWTDSKIYECIAVHWDQSNLGMVKADPISYANVSLGTQLSGHVERAVTFTWNVGGRPETAGVELDEGAVERRQELKICDNETELIMRFAEWIASNDIEILLGYNIASFDNSYIATRARKLGVDRYLLERMSRLRNHYNAPTMVQKNVFIRGMNVQVEWFSGHGMLQIDVLHVFRKKFNYPSYTLDYVSQTNLGDQINKWEVPTDGSPGLIIHTDSTSLLRPLDFVSLLIAKFITESYSPKWQVLDVEKKKLRIVPTVPTDLHAFVAEARACEENQATFRWGLVKDDLPHETMRRYAVSTNPRERGLVAKYCAQDCHLPLLLLHRVAAFFEFSENAILNSITIKDVIARGQNARAAAGCTKFGFSKALPVQFEEWKSPPRNPKERRVKRYEGAIVATPVIRLWEDVDCNDFNSLYPSITIELELDSGRIVAVEYLLFVHPGSATRVTEIQKQLHALLTQTSDPQYANALMQECIPPIDGTILPEQQNYYRIDKEVVYNEQVWQEVRASEPTGYFRDNQSAELRPRWCPHAWRVNGVETIRCHDRNMITVEKDPKKRKVIGVVRVYTVSITHRYHPNVNAVDASIVPALSNKFIQVRKKQKKALKELVPGSTDYSICDAKQLAVKETNNSMYGMGGDPVSKIYDLEHAPCVTGCGRRSILFTVDTIRRIREIYCHIGFPESMPLDDQLCSLCGTAGGWMPTVCKDGREEHVVPDGTTECPDHPNGKVRVQCNWTVCAEGHYTHARHGDKDATNCGICKESVCSGQQRRPLRTRRFWLDDRPVAAAGPHDWTEADWLVQQYLECLKQSPFEWTTFQRSMQYRRGLQIVEQLNGFVRFQKAYLAAKVVNGKRQILWEQAFAAIASSAEPDEEESSAAANSKQAYYMPVPATTMDQVIGSPCEFPVEKCTDVYGDTDSVFFHATLNRMKTLVSDPNDQTRIYCAVAAWSAAMVSKHLGCPMNLEFEKHLKQLLLVSKKRYFSMIVKPDHLDMFELMCQGLAIKKKDTSEIFRKIQGQLNEAMVLEGMTVGAALTEMQHWFEELMEDRIPLHQLAIPKPLRDTYKKPETIPQWVLANRIGRMDPGRQPKPGETMLIIHTVPPGYEHLTLEQLEEQVPSGNRIELLDMVVEQKLKVNKLYYFVKQLCRPMISTFIATDPEGVFQHFGEQAHWNRVIAPKLQALAATRYGMDGMRRNEYVVDLTKFLSEQMMHVIMRNLMSKSSTPSTMGLSLTTKKPKGNKKERAAEMCRPIAQFFSSSVGGGDVRSDTIGKEDVMVGGGDKLVPGTGVVSAAPRSFASLFRSAAKSSPSSRTNTEV